MTNRWCGWEPADGFLLADHLETRYGLHITGSHHTPQTLAYIIKTRIPLVFLIWLGGVSMLWLTVGYLHGKSLREVPLDFILIWAVIAVSGFLIVAMAFGEASRCFERRWRDEGASCLAITAFIPFVVLFGHLPVYRPMYALGVRHAFDKTTEIRREVSHLIGERMKRRQFISLQKDKLPPHLRSLSEFGSLSLSRTGLSLKTGGTITFRSGYFIRPLHDEEPDVAPMDGITRWHHDMNNQG